MWKWGMGKRKAVRLYRMTPTLARFFGFAGLNAESCVREDPMMFLTRVRKRATSTSHTMSLPVPSNTSNFVCYQPCCKVVCFCVVFLELSCQFRLWRVGYKVR
ncbi:hypothetical protein BDN72DRAFT_233307 [Pluteus cervinus]|uniref:Uncharacterized protein n=1 Tax=Pluteus cervinus TaxID=181527 RepID=A0ACD3BE49_9AGAR|nr:hypothetical protein BDN72DRAFT_233307 [Pluteus cervinus]